MNARNMVKNNIYLSGFAKATDAFKNSNKLRIKFHALAHPNYIKNNNCKNKIYNIYWNHEMFYMHYYTSERFYHLINSKNF